MRALTLRFGQPGSLSVHGIDEPLESEESVPVESIAVGVTADEVHVLVTAIKEMEQPDTLDGVFDYRGPLAGALVEEEAWQFPNFAELSVAPAPWGGLAVLARNIGADHLRDAGLSGGRMAAPIRHPASS